MNRQAVVSNALWGAEVATRQPKQIHYGEVRPIRGAPRQLPLTTDCSGFVTLCYQWAGAPDPNGTHYDGTGSTGTMLHACAHIRPNEAQLADLIVFGAAPGTHVVLIVETGPDPVVVSQRVVNSSNTSVIFTDITGGQAMGTVGDRGRFNS